jgi:hypothetical protein
MPSTHAESMLLFIVAGLNLGWVQTAPQQCNKESDLLRLCSDTCSSSPILNGIHWHNTAQNFKCGRVRGHRNSQGISTLRVFTMWTTENLVFSFDILPPIIFKRHSKSVGVILIQFLNPDPSSIFRVSKRSSPCLCPPANNWRIHQCLGLLFLLCSRSNTRDADIAARANSCDMTERNYSRQTCQVWARFIVSGQRPGCPATLCPSVLLGINV